MAFQTIDEAEYRIFAAIDGSRCIDEILPIAAAAGAQPHAAANGAVPLRPDGIAARPFHTIAHRPANEG